MLISYMGPQRERKELKPGTRSLCGDLRRVYIEQDERNQKSSTEYLQIDKMLWALGP